MKSSAHLVKERFDLNWIPEPFSGCWIWTGGVSPKGYGRIMINCKSKAAHRASWEIYIGDIPGNLLACHKCDTPSCVNPNHLFLGTCADNKHDSMRKGRHTQGEKGHAKLRESDVRAIRASTLSTKKLASTFGVHIATINRVKAGTIWRQAI